MLGAGGARHTVCTAGNHHSLTSLVQNSLCLSEGSLDGNVSTISSFLYMVPLFELYVDGFSRSETDFSLHTASTSELCAIFLQPVDVFASPNALVLSGSVGWEG